MCTTKASFRAEVEQFLERSGMSATAFGRAALRDPNFVRDLKSGRAPNLDLVDRVHAFIKTHDGAPA